MEVSDLDDPEGYHDDYYGGAPLSASLSRTPGPPPPPGATSGWNTPAFNTVCPLPLLFVVSLPDSLQRLILCANGGVRPGMSLRLSCSLHFYVQPEAWNATGMIPTPDGISPMSLKLGSPSSARVSKGGPGNHGGGMGGGGDEMVRAP